MLKNKTVAFLGAGSMAEAMISGMVQAEKLPANQIIVTNRSNEERLHELQAKYGVKGMKREELVFDDVDVFILAMKPKDIDVALDSIKSHLKPHQLLLSVLAGISTSYMEDHLANGQQVIRVMPNTSSMMGESATAMSPGQHTAMDNVMVAKELLTCIGEVYIIDEEKMDIFTGIAGSGPAYFYYLMEHIERAGAEEGLDPEMARQIGAQTILGAAKMIMEQEETPSQLRENVTSPNGTTAAGLDALAKYGGGEAIKQAVKGASKRSKEISSKLQKVMNA
ncbi:pyrroline-5-carboxylate reductase [Bacillus sp. CGMCC 1.16541]|uniref:pyrroline-5-carboxylate reductase n=1 Tax=Bacillus sp. CGMCC 1.16541 TaxID=2185143 RepID=UPI000D732837|nr:pyrroline-5-carboxylate reductase [Bacillus sp. CGMCC 1.16541]